MNFSIVLTVEQLNIVDKALKALPLGQALDLYLSIKNQIDSQNPQKKSEKEELIETKNSD